MQPAENVKLAAKSLYPLIKEELSKQNDKVYGKTNMTMLDLDNWRNNELPELLKTRHEKKDCKLKKDELVLLLDWKLAFGVYRPSLPKLIKSNTEESIERVTREGFGIFLDFTKSIDEKDNFWETKKQDLHGQYKDIVKKSIKKFCELKGVGPATASLILSLTSKVEPIMVPPFFSDESFIYFILEAQRPDTKIKYNFKEYCDEYIPLFVSVLCETSDHDLNMNVLEKGGWALKMYDIHRLDTLCDIKPKFDIEEKDLKFFQWNINTQEQTKTENDHQEKPPEKLQPRKKRKTAK